MKKENNPLLLFSAIIIVVLIGILVLFLIGNKNDQERVFLLQHQEDEFTQNMEQTTSEPLLLKFPLYCYNQSCQISKEIDIHNIIGKEVEVQVRITDNQAGKEILRESAEHIITLFPTDQLLINASISYPQADKDPVAIFYYILPNRANYSLIVNEYL